MSTFDPYSEPDPSGSPLEKIKIARRTPSPRDFTRYLQREGVDPDLARRIGRAVQQWESEMHYDEIEQLINMEMWANTHTHPGSSGGGGGLPPETDFSSLFVTHAGRADFSSWSDNVWDTTPTNRPLATSGQPLIRIGDYLYSLDTDSAANFYRFNLTTESWEGPLTHLDSIGRLRGNDHSGNNAQCTDGTYLYVVGGFNPSNAATAWVDAYDPETDTWSSLSDLPAVRCDGGAVVAGRVLYYMGGYTSNSASTLTTVFKLDLDTGVWSTAPNPLPEGRQYIRPVYHVGTGLVWIIGGRFGGAAQNQVWSLDPSDDSFLTGYTVCPYSSWCQGIAGTQFGIHVAGGSGTAVHHVYDPTSDTWTAKANLTFSGFAGLAPAV